MKAMQLFVFVSACGLFMAVSHPVQAKDKDKWVCMKDGTEVKVKGKSAKDKEKSCEGQGGMWEKSKGGSEKQSSGSGGAW